METHVSLMQELDVVEALSLRHKRGNSLPGNSL